MYDLLHLLAKLFEGSYKTLIGEDGQTLAEYGLLVILIAMVVILILRGTGQEVNNLFSTINNSIP
ncbi:MAG: hypothetical protein P8013_12780 [Candidatus Sulfobium sp.]